MTYEEAREFIDQANQYGSVLGLEAITELLDRLGNPQEQLNIIHVAGTNGKGSTGAFLTAILNQAGYRVGRYISPSVFSYRERIQISCKDTKYHENSREESHENSREESHKNSREESHKNSREEIHENGYMSSQESSQRYNQKCSRESSGENSREERHEYVYMSRQESSQKCNQECAHESRQENSQQVISYISREGVSQTIEMIKPACESMVREGYSHPTSFEIETAMTFLYLLREKVDFVVLEVGMGGRLDATNVIRKPVCCVITSISMDHMQYLGDTPLKIASEKAGIIKAGCPVVTCEQEPEVLEVLENKAAETGSGLYVADSRRAMDISYSIEGTEFIYKSEIGNGDSDKPHRKGYVGCDKACSFSYRIHLLGTHQVKNAVLAMEAARVLKQLGYDISEEAIKAGLLTARWSGRFELLSTKPYLVIDGAHNEEAAIMLREAIEIYFAKHRIIFIIGVLADKEYRSILKITAPLADKIYTLTPKNVRALGSALLAEEARRFCDRVIDAGNITQALKLAYAEAGEEDVIIAFGSLSFLGDLVRTIAAGSDQKR